MLQWLKPNANPPAGTRVDLPLTRSFFSVFVAAIGSCAVGYALAYPSSALIDLAELPNGRAFETASTESQLFVALLAVGGILGSILGGVLSNRVGRRAVLLVSGLVDLIGWLLIFIAQYTETSSAFKALLLLGRFWTGVGSGALGSIVPVYAAEVAPPHRRGMLSSFHQISIISGVFLSYVVGAIPGLLYSHSAIAVIVILMVFQLLMLIPKESPRWLLMKNDKYAARKSLLWFFRSEESVETILASIESSLATKKVTFYEKIRVFKGRSAYLPFLLSIATILFHQFTGNNVIINYAASIFQTAEVNHARETAIYAVGILQIVGTIISSFVVDKVGRKKLLLFGSIGIAASNIALGTHLFITEHSQCTNSSANFSNNTTFFVDEVSNSTDAYADSHCFPGLLSILAITSVMGFGLFYSIGWRALPFVMMGEMFPNSLRSTLNGILHAFIWGLIAIIIGGFAPFERAVRPYTVWWVFAGVSVASIPFIILLLPETKGKTLEEIQQYFDRKKVRKRIVAASNPVLTEGATCTVCLEEIENREEMYKETDI